VSGTHIKAIYVRTRAAGLEDVAVTTHDIWCEGGDSTDAQCDTLAASFVTFWTVLAGNSGTLSLVSSGVKLSELRFYRGYDGDGSPGSVDYVKTYNQSGLLPAVACPPQVACTVTELTDARRHWGRFYIPSISTTALNADGTLKSTQVASVANAAEALYESWGALAGHTPIVWGRKRASISYNTIGGGRWRPTWLSPAGSTAEVGEPLAIAVQSIRVDEILDIQRRRRWESTQLRETRALA
jgi:hypothetical protein